MNKNGIYSIGFVGYRIENEEKTFQISTNLKSIPIVVVGAWEVETEVHEIPTASEWELYIAQIQEMLKNSVDTAGDFRITLKPANTSSIMPKIAYFRISGTFPPGWTANDVIMTVNQEII